MLIEPAFNPGPYESQDTVRIINPRQSSYYAANGCHPKDIYISNDRRTGEPVWVYIFSREETQNTGVYDAWCKRKQEEIDRGE